MLHLYDPSTQTHYADRGMFDNLHPVPKEGLQWIEGMPPENAILYQYTTGFYVAENILSTLSDEVKAEYYSEITQIRQAIAEGEEGVVPYILQKINPTDPEEQEKLNAIKQAIGM